MLKCKQILDKHSWSLNLALKGCTWLTLIISPDFLAYERAFCIAGWKKGNQEWLILWHKPKRTQLCSMSKNTVLLRSSFFFFLLLRRKGGPKVQQSLVSTLTD